MVVLDSGSPHVFGYVRQNDGARVLALANFSETEQRIAANALRLHGLSYSFTDLVTGQTVSLGSDLVLGAYRFVWLKADS
jgi:amylosucrase